MSYEALMGNETETAVATEVAKQPVLAPPLIDVRAEDFVMRLNQPSIDWLPFWLGGAAGLFIGWIVFRAGRGEQQLEQIGQKAIDKVFGQ